MSAVCFSQMSGCFVCSSSVVGNLFFAVFVVLTVKQGVKGGREGQKRIGYHCRLFFVKLF